MVLSYGSLRKPCNILDLNSARVFYLSSSFCLGTRPWTNSCNSDIHYTERFKPCLLPFGPKAVYYSNHASLQMFNSSIFPIISAWKLAKEHPSPLLSQNSSLSRNYFVRHNHNNQQGLLNFCFLTFIPNVSDSLGIYGSFKLIRQ